MKCEFPNPSARSVNSRLHRSRGVGILLEVVYYRHGGSNRDNWEGDPLVSILSCHVTDQVYDEGKSILGSLLPPRSVNSRHITVESVNSEHMH